MEDKINALCTRKARGSLWRIKGEKKTAFGAKGGREKLCTWGEQSRVILGRN